MIRVKPFQSKNRDNIDLDATVALLQTQIWKLLRQGLSGRESRTTTYFDIKILIEF